MKLSRIVFAILMAAVIIFTFLACKNGDLSSESFQNEDSSAPTEIGTPSFEDPPESSSTPEEESPITKQDNTTYKFSSEYYKDVNGISLDISYFEKYSGDELVWSVPFHKMSIRGYSVVSTGIIVYGETYMSDTARIIKLDKNGNILWKCNANNGLNDNIIADVLENDDGTYTVFSRGDLTYLCLSKYTSDGELIDFKKMEMKRYSIKNVAHYGEGYIVQLSSLISGDQIVMLDSSGNIIDVFSYSTEDCSYYITDMIEFNEKIYLSAYAVPKPSDDIPIVGFVYNELSNVLGYLFANNISKISDEELTPMIQENYTAMLLVRDPSTGTPHEFYSVKGSLGGKLTLSDSGALLWDVESITSTFYSPATNSFIFGGKCDVYRYTFSADGALTKQEKTGEVTDFRK